MKNFTRFLLYINSFIFIGCSTTSTVSSNKPSAKVPEKSTSEVYTPLKSNAVKNNIASRTINTKNTNANELVNFAETLIGIKYKYASMKKEEGFDCSGFINYVFNNFNISVPRSSVDFTNAGKEVDASVSKRGDIILFTGTDTTNWVVGHMGIITQNDNGKISFIHSSSGKANGVVVSELSKYYRTRFVKVIRVFE